MAAVKMTMVTKLMKNNGEEGEETRMTMQCDQIYLHIKVLSRCPLRSLMGLLSNKLDSPWINTQVLWQELMILSPSHH